MENPNDETPMYKQHKTIMCGYDIVTYGTARSGCVELFITKGRTNNNYQLHLIRGFIQAFSIT